MLDTPFLTDIDPRRAVKGSRDPLGMVGMWSLIGRHVVGNLTTASTSLRDFTITALGFTLVERVLESGHDEPELSIFLRWEQLCGYARAMHNKERGFRGTERVHRVLDESDSIVLSADRGFQILSNQKTYGLWGLYTVPSRASGLLDAQRLRPSQPTRDHADQVWWPVIHKALGGDGGRLLELLRRGKAHLDVDGRDREILALVAGLIRPKLRPGEREFYTTHLVQGGPDREQTRGLQRQFASLLAASDLDPDEPLSPSVLRALAKHARAQHGRDSDLAARLEAIRTCESVLAPASRLFDWLQTQRDRAVADVAREIQKQWGPRVTSVDAEGFRELREDLLRAVNGPEAFDLWQRLADTMAAGDYRTLVMTLLDLNAHVMSARDGASPWIEVRSGKLHLRFQDAQGDLPERSELAGLWRNPYFIDSLRGMVAAIEGAD